ncbi:hypothetical protein BaRGS_00002269 [Batillaria attramentaria]|uniref:Uncharacterized protein n=1 Tax=Batillaria attramentaria TaxID=370345 RepID=A0ABD0M4J2_9CAEN
MEHGYDIDLASGEAVDAKYGCPVCLFVMRNPMQTGCGHRFCKACITKVTGERPWGKCPVDKTVFRKGDSLFNDIAMHREIMSLKVKCKNSEDCTWTGELRDLEKHLKECPMEEVKCPVSCGTMLLRGEVDAHKGQCPQRWITCGHCEQNVVFSQLHDKRVNIQTHYEDNLEQHMSLLMGQFSVLAAKNEALQEELAVAKTKIVECDSLSVEHTNYIEKLKARTRCGRLIWKLDLNNMYPLPPMVLSPPFYSSCPGYQMRLRVDFNGVRDGDSYYTSVFVVLQRGEFDMEIPFPFNGQVRVTVMNQSNSRNKQHVSVVIPCSDVPRNSSGASNARANSRGHTRFIKKSELLSQTYCKNKVIYFEANMVVPCENCGTLVSSSQKSVPASPSSV